MGTRRYVYDQSKGQERPVWASNKSLIRMGQEWAEAAYRRGDGEPGPYGNVTHDLACARRWEILTGKFPSWFKES